MLWWWGCDMCVCVAWFLFLLELAPTPFSVPIFGLNPRCTVEHERIVKYAMKSQCALAYNCGRIFWLLYCTFNCFTVPFTVAGHPHAFAVDYCARPRVFLFSIFIFALILVWWRGACCGLTLINVDVEVGRVDKQAWQGFVDVDIDSSISPA